MSIISTSHSRDKRPCLRQSKYSHVRQKQLLLKSNKLFRSLNDVVLPVFTSAMAVTVAAALVAAALVAALVAFESR